MSRAWILVLLPCIFGCATLKTAFRDMHDHGSFGITESDIKKTHDFKGWYNECWVYAIEPDEKQANELKNMNVYFDKDEFPVRYILATRPRASARGGRIFVVRGKGEWGDYELMACFHKDKLLHEIYVRTNPKDADGNEVITKEFLSQFVNRSLDQSGEFRENMEDCLYAPTRLAAIKDAPVTSRDIAQRLKKIFVTVQVVKLR